MAQHFLLSKAAKTLTLASGLPHDGRGSRGRRSARSAGPRPTARRSARIAAAWTPTIAAARTARRASNAKPAARISASRPARCSPRTSCRCAAYLAAIAIFCNEVKGKSALALSRDLGLSYKTAFVLLHKLREAMADGNEGPHDRRRRQGCGSRWRLFRRLCEARQPARKPQGPPLRR